MLATAELADGASISEFALQIRQSISPWGESSWGVNVRPNMADAPYTRK